MKAELSGWSPAWCQSLVTTEEVMTLTPRGQVVQTCPSSRGREESSMFPWPEGTLLRLPSSKQQWTGNTRHKLITPNCPSLWLLFPGHVSPIWQLAKVAVTARCCVGLFILVINCRGTKAWRAADRGTLVAALGRSAVTASKGKSTLMKPGAERKLRKTGKERGLLELQPIKSQFLSSLIKWMKAACF